MVVDVPNVVDVARETGPSAAQLEFNRGVMPATVLAPRSGDWFCVACEHVHPFVAHSLPVVVSEKCGAGCPCELFVPKGRTL